MGKKHSEKEETKEIPAAIEEGKQTLIVGIGASAGGVEALVEFFEQVTVNSGMAYVVILHLSPDYDSRLTEILRQVSSIPVTQVTENVKIEADHVYIVPPNKHLQMRDDIINVSPNIRQEERRAPVDIFFRSLAESHGRMAVGVILSGTGANGSMGLKRIKENGGAVFVQNPREAAFNEMPRHAIATNLVDDILPVAQLPEKLVSYQNSLGKVSIRVDPGMRPDSEQQALREIFAHLRLRTGHDFSNYKRPTLMRRFERRISVRNLPDLPAYVTFLHENPDEAQALLKDLLISVTNFFRDSKPFQALEDDILPTLIRERSNDVIRIWVAGCATGEEAYSLAMLMAEKTMDVLDAPKVQIFATDIDEAAIAIAREGRYTLNDAADIPADRLRQFLVPDGDDFRVRQEIREMVLFAHHNVLKDPPFSRIDLVTCRNLLIYFNSAAQERVMETFHFALRPGGYLLLGLSETTDGAGDLFAPVSRENHIYQSRPVSIRSYPVPESNFLVPAGRRLVSENSSSKESRSLQSRLNFGDLHQQLLERYAPPSIIVNEDYDILHLSERAGKYLHIAGGEPSKNLLKLIRPELRLELRTAFYQAVQQKSNVEAPNLNVRIDDRMQTLTLHVRPVLDEDNIAGSDPARGLLLVIFEPTGQHTEPTTSILASEEPMARQLEEELVRLKAQLRTSSEQHETQAEELKASNEELQAINEELHSAAEELETSKEELQSINEELTTVNQELKVKLEEISITRNNLQNLINSTDLATLFLDRSLRVILFTPAARSIFNLIQSDSGRPLTDITNRLDDNDLLRDAEAVLEKLQPVEREVKTSDGQLFLMRVLPYRTAEDRINGVVLTFVDISRRRAAEEAVRQSEERMRLVFDSAKDYAIFTFDLQRKISSWSPGAHSITGYSESDVLGHTSDIIFTLEDRQNGIPELEEQTTLNQGRAINERWHLRKDGTRFWGSGSVSPLKDVQGKLLGFVKIMRDLTEHRAAEEAKSFLAAIVESSQDAIMTVNFEGVITSWNEAAHDLYGYSAAQAVGKPLTMLTLPADLDQLLKDTENIKVSQKVEIFDTIRVNKNGAEMHLEVVMSPVKNKSGKVIGVSTIARDITLRKQSEYAEALKNLTLQQQTELLAGTGSWEYNRSTEEFIWSEGMYQLFGLPIGEPVYTDIYVDFTRGAEKEAARRFTDWLRAGTEAIEQVLRIHAGDAVRYLKIRGVALANEGGPPVKALGIDWDITDQVLAQEQIRQSEAQLRTLVENTPDVITRWDNDLRLLFANSAFIGKSGEPLENLLGKTNAEMGQPEDSTGSYMEKLRQTFETGQPQEHYNRFPTPTGRFEYYSRMVPERGPDGSVQSVLAIARDITELQSAQQQTRQLAENLQAVLDASPACIGLLKAVRAGADGSLVTGFKLAVGNQKLAEFFGQPLHELLGKQADHFDTLLWGPETHDFLMQVYHDNEPRYDEKYLTTDGQERWLAVAISRQDDGVVLTGLDITQLKEAQTQQQFWLGELENASQSAESVAHLRDALKERGELLRSASHDLRGQVGVIASAAQLLGMAGSEADNNILIQMIQRNTQQMTQLMSSLLDFARLEAAQEVIHVSRFDLAGLLLELAENTQPFATERGLALNALGPTEMEVESDPVQIRRIAQNLLLNALKYTDMGGVTINWEKDGMGWSFKVVDTGPGLPAKLLARLRGEFQEPAEGEVVITPGRSAGEGIGLAIVTRLCTLLGGRLEVDSHPDEGTTFRISFLNE
ncbi:PAS domain S-box protein [Dyadobacter sp. CY323]|uniref:PAS domain S-box protein n=1 Tax=Dyadobacter sp. CY323 TaxID=2907302 RepID=UPI001F27E7D2|nr:PAS domain S-box protein [Dyadobacter sp. CY323]MCE6992950.1 PAS domain S-box protein [Dyadobacter sp. CY323]